jgi:hypothetical protein
MTTMCFIHMVPPYFAAGAGAEMRRAVGRAMLWGAFGVTLFGLFLTPVFFYVLSGLDRRGAAGPRAGRGGDRSGFADTPAGDTRRPGFLEREAGDVRGGR